MTKKQALKTVKEMQRSMSEYVLKESERLLNTGAIDYERYDKDDLSLGKILICAAMQNGLDNFGPIAPENKAELKNLLKF